MQQNFCKKIIKYLWKNYSEGIVVLDLLNLHYLQVELETASEQQRNYGTPTPSKNNNNQLFIMGQNCQCALSQRRRV